MMWEEKEEREDLSVLGVGARAFEFLKESADTTPRTLHRILLLARTEILLRKITR